MPTQPCSWLLRNLVRLIALALLLMGLVVNFSGFFDDSSDNAGMSGCVALGIGTGRLLAWRTYSTSPSFSYSPHPPIQTTTLPCSCSCSPPTTTTTPHTNDLATGSWA